MDVQYVGCMGILMPMNAPNFSSLILYLKNCFAWHWVRMDPLLLVRWPHVQPAIIGYVWVTCCNIAAFPVKTLCEYSLSLHAWLLILLYSFTVCHTLIDSCQLLDYVAYLSLSSRVAIF